MQNGNIKNWNIGVDICDVVKFHRYHLSSYPHFYQKMFTQKEIDYCNQYKRSEIHFAGIFAAKEAVFKAINHFIIISITDIEINHDKKGAPIVFLLNQNSDKKINKNKMKQSKLIVQVSISHSKKLAIAFAFAYNNPILITPMREIFETKTNEEIFNEIYQK